MAESDAGRAQQLRLWLVHVLTVPGFVQCVVKATTECATTLVSERVFARLLALLKREASAAAATTGRSPVSGKATGAIAAATASGSSASASASSSILPAIAQLSSIQLLSLAGALRLRSSLQLLKSISIFAFFLFDGDAIVFDGNVIHSFAGNLIQLSILELEGLADDPAAFCVRPLPSTAICFLLVHDVLLHFGHCLYTYLIL